MGRKFFVIWNPFAGGKSRKICESLIHTLKEKDLDHQLFDTYESKSATSTLKEFLDTSYTDLIIIGGDGTINESVNGLNYDIPVSIIPAGTGDEFHQKCEYWKVAGSANYYGNKGEGSSN